MSNIKSHSDLIIWQKAVALVTKIYSVTSTFPSTEIYGLTNQLKRCAVSIPRNVAEGYGRNSTTDYKRFLQIAVGSLYELQTQVEIAFNLTYVSKDQYNDLFNNSKTKIMHLLTRKTIPVCLFAFQLMPLLNNGNQTHSHRSR